MLCVFLGNHDMCDDDFTEVIQKESGKNLLLDMHHLFGMKATEANGIFQFPESRFNTSAHGVKLF